MELFYSRDIADGGLFLDKEESNHCVRVLRHRNGDTINIVDGCGCLYECEIVNDDPKCLEFKILQVQQNWGSHPYHLHMAVAPPKNIDRFEWFAEKATEIGVDEITPLFGEYSERKIFKGERVERLIIAAAKQSHKAAIPTLHEAISVKDFLISASLNDSLKLICYCDEVESLGVQKKPVTELLAARSERPVVIMIGPEGDFSRSEMELAVQYGWQPVSLGDSRLRIETAALTATAAVYLSEIPTVPPPYQRCDPARS